MGAERAEACENIFQIIKLCNCKPLSLGEIEQCNNYASQDLKKRNNRIFNSHLLLT